MGLMNKRTLLLGGLAVAAVAGALKNRERVAGLIGVRSGGSQPPSPDSGTYAPPEQMRTPVREEPAPAPTPANYDLSGPAANTATPVPVPEAASRGDGAVDERAEEEAAAAEAAAIGGATPQYAGFEPGEPADEEEHAVVESGGGDAEGQEQAEADLQDNAEPAAGDPLYGGRRIDAAIEAQDDPFAGEDAEGAANEPPRAEAAGLSGQPEERGEPARSATSGGTSAYTSAEAEALEDEPTRSADPGDEQGRFFAGGKGEEEPEEGPAPGLPDEDAARAAERAAGGETPAEKKSSAVWSAPDEDSEGDTGEWQTWSGRAKDS